MEPFDPKFESIIYSDSCAEGVGFILVQKSPENKISIICTGSKGLTSPQTRYSVFDLELSAIVFALKKLQDYVSGGLHFTILTDHKANGQIRNDHLRKHYFMSNVKGLRVCVVT